MPKRVPFWVPSVEQPSAASLEIKVVAASKVLPLVPDSERSGATLSATPETSNRMAVTSKVSSNRAIMIIKVAGALPRSSSNRATTTVMVTTVTTRPQES